MKNRYYVAGWDGGGTKTVCALRFFEKEASLKEVTALPEKRMTAGALNVTRETGKGIKKTAEELLRFMKETGGGLSSCAYLTIGTAGASNPSVVSNLRKALKEEGYHGNLLIEGDHIAALKGGLAGSPGAIVIAGTGAIAVGEDGEGRRFRVGGYGHLIDDEGSGYAIGRDLLSAAVREADGREAKGSLLSILYEALGIERIEELIAFVYGEGTGKKEIAGLAPLLEKGLAAGDPAAEKILTKAAGELFLLADTVLKKLLKKDGRLVFGGSLLLKTDALRERLLSLLKERRPEVRISPPLYDAATGAVILSAERVLQRVREH